MDNLYTTEQAIIANLKAKIAALEARLEAAEKISANKFLSEEDFAILFTTSEQLDDSDGYTTRKDDMHRLAELGVIQHHGFGKYSVTSFGAWLIETKFEQKTSLPLRTVAEYNEIQRAAMKESGHE